MIRNIDEKTLEKLKAKAAVNNRSLQNELHEMIERHAGNDLTEFKSLIIELQAEYKESQRDSSLRQCRNYTRIA